MLGHTGRCEVRHLSLDVVQHLALGLHEDSHVQEDLVQVQQSPLELPDGVVPLLDLRQCVLDLCSPAPSHGWQLWDHCSRHLHEACHAWRSCQDCILPCKGLEASLT